MSNRSTLEKHQASPQDDTGEYPGVERTAVVSAEFGSATHPGKVRENNEDQFLVARLTKAMNVLTSSLPGHDDSQRSQDVGYLTIVADGMGGAAAGEQASALAVATVEDFVLNTLKWCLHLKGNEGDTLLGELREALERADRAVLERAMAEPRLRGMGTTLTMGYSVGAGLFIVHAGDSRAYLFHDGQLDQITSDHTLVQLLLDHGAISPEEAKRHKRRNVVTNVVGGPSEGVNVEVHKLQLHDGDVVLLCSDGLSEPVDHDTIAEILGSARGPKEACDRLIERALEAGAPDNVTAVVAKYRVE
jgi:serine/threonine protein phosphatase PrpC